MAHGGGRGTAAVAAQGASGGAQDAWPMATARNHDGGGDTRRERRCVGRAACSGCKEPRQRRACSGGGGVGGEQRRCKERVAGHVWQRRHTGWERRSAWDRVRVEGKDAWMRLVARISNTGM